MNDEPVDIGITVAILLVASAIVAGVLSASAALM